MILRLLRLVSSCVESRVAFDLFLLLSVLKKKKVKQTIPWFTAERNDATNSLLIPPKRFDIFSPITGGCSEGLGVV